MIPGMHGIPDGVRHGTGGPDGDGVRHGIQRLDVQADGHGLIIVPVATVLTDQTEDG